MINSALQRLISDIQKTTLEEFNNLENNAMTRAVWGLVLLSFDKWLATSKQRTKENYDKFYDEIVYTLGNLPFKKRSPVTTKLGLNLD